MGYATTDDDAEVGANLLRQEGDAGCRQRTEQQYIGTCCNEPRFEGGLKHVARQACVLAYQHSTAGRNENLRCCAGQTQGKVRTHRVFADRAAYAIGSEVLPSHLPVQPP
jgi:hypothetical protein